MAGQTDASGRRFCLATQLVWSASGIKGLTPWGRDFSLNQNLIYGCKYSEHSERRSAAEEGDGQGPTQEGDRPHQFAPQALSGAYYQIADPAAGWPHRRSGSPGACGSPERRSRASACRAPRCRCPHGSTACSNSRPPRGSGARGWAAPRERSGYHPRHCGGGDRVGGGGQHALPLVVFA